MPEGVRELRGGGKVEVAAATEGGKGRVYVAVIPLDAGKWDLFVTPPAPPAASAVGGSGAGGGLGGLGAGRFHRLAHTERVAREEGLAVVVNDSMFAGGSWPVRREGEMARTTETTVVEGEVVNLWEHSYMLGFLPDLTPVPVSAKPPPVEQMKGWKWGISGQSWQAFGGKQAWWEKGLVERRTVVGVDEGKRLLYLGVLEKGTHADAAAELMKRGATHAFCLDGGESSTMVVEGKAITGDWRPVANHFGVRAK